MIDILGKIIILLNKRNNTALIIRHEKEKKGTLEGWFSHETYQLSQEDISKMGWCDFHKIITGSFGGLCPEQSLPKASEFKNYKIVGLTLFSTVVTVSPYEKSDRYGGAIGKYSVDIQLPVDDKEFRKALEKAIEDAG